MLGSMRASRAILLARDAQRARERLEHRFDVVMAGAPVQHLDVHVRARADREAFEEVVHELGLQIADLEDVDSQIDRGVRASAEIDRGDGQRLVHRHDEVAGAVDAAPLPERGRDRLAERDAEVLDGVMLIDVEVARRVDAQVERAVARKQLEHVIEKADPRPYLITALTFERQRQGDLRLGRISLDYRAAHKTSSTT